MVFVLLLLAACVTAKPYEALWREDIGGTIIPKGSKLTMHQQGESLLLDISRTVDKWLVDHNVAKRPAATLESANPYPYFGFIPYFQGGVIPDGPPFAFDSRCFKSASVVAKTVSSTNYSLTFTFKQHTLGCEDFYLIADFEGAELLDVSAEGTKAIQWQISPTATDADRYDITHYGFRVLMFNAGKKETIQNVADTVAMFEAFFQPTVSAECAARNQYFIEQYSGFVLDNRTAGLVNIDPSLIHDGDFFGVLRLDGVDPMLAWAMGSTTGHTTIALHINGSLHVCESTTLDAYWPTNGVQCTPWTTWVAQTNAANMNIDWCPLDSKYSSLFNGAKAYDYFQTVSGFDYGWYNLLYGWIDTETDNYPCVPPYPSKQCLVFDTALILFSVLQRVDYPFIDEIFLQAMNIRLGTNGLNVSEVMEETDKQGINRPSLPVIVETDTFLYNTSRNGVPTQGPSMVCCVFVCEMWKHGGLFAEINDEINCAELTNWDDYSLAFFSNEPRPSVCTSADPNNAVCQIMGDYKLILNNYDSKPEYAHMAEHCPTEAQNNYTKPADC